MNESRSVPSHFLRVCSLWDFARQGTERGSGNFFHLANNVSTDSTLKIEYNCFTKFLKHQFLFLLQVSLPR